MQWIEGCGLCSGAQHTVLITHPVLQMPCLSCCPYCSKSGFVDSFLEELVKSVHASVSESTLAKTRTVFQRIHEAASTHHSWRLDLICRCLCSLWIRTQLRTLDGIAYLRALQYRSQDLAPEFGQWHQHTRVQVLKNSNPFSYRKG